MRREKRENTICPNTYTPSNLIHKKKESQFGDLEHKQKSQNTTIFTIVVSKLLVTVLFFLRYACNVAMQI